MIKNIFPKEMTLIGAQHYLLDDKSWNDFLKSDEHKIALLAFWADEDYATMLLLDYDVPFRLSVKIHLRRYSAVSQRYPSALWGEVMARDLWGVEAINAAYDFSFDEGGWSMTWPLSHSALETEGKIITRPERGQNGCFNIPFLQTGIAGLCDIRTRLIEGKMGDIGVHLASAHRGIIKQLIGKTKEDALPLIEKISGGGFIAHPLAFMKAWEDAEGYRLDERERDRRFIFLELERISLHLYDLGQMAHHGGKEILSSYCVYMHEKMADIFEKYALPRRLTNLFSWSYECDLFRLCADILHFMKKHLDELSALYDFFSSDFREIGVLTTEDAWLYAIGGVVGRASGRAMDMRRRERGMRLDALRAMGEYHGCVAARGRQRLAEIRDSLALMQMILDHFALSAGDDEIKGSGDGLGVVEGARGDIWYWVGLKEGKIEKIFIRDPSLSITAILKEMIEGEEPQNLALILSSLGFSPAGAAL